MTRGAERPMVICSSALEDTEGSASADLSHPFRPPLLLCHQHSPSWPRDRRGCLGNTTRVHVQPWGHGHSTSGPGAVALSGKTRDSPPRGRIWAPHHQELLAFEGRVWSLVSFEDFSGAGNRVFVPSLLLNLPLEL